MVILSSNSPADISDNILLVLFIICTLNWFTKFNYVMLNILIIKDDSLGNKSQISVVLRDLEETSIELKIKSIINQQRLMAG